MIFVDTSVLVAASLVSHPYFAASDALVKTHQETGIACSGHALAEIYVTLSTFPSPRRIRPLEAVEIVESWRNLCKVMPLSPKDYVDFLRDAAKRGLSGPAIYDALHIACARKANAFPIYTLNVRHFRLVAPDMASSIQEP